MSLQLASSIMNKVAILLFDVNNIKWSRAELLGWVNDGQRAIIALIPEANSKVVVQKCVAGVRQTLPADGYMMLEGSRNMGTNGTTSGRVLKRADREVLEESNPNWSFDTAAPAATMYMYNLRDRLAFYVYPPNDGTGYLELVYSAIPVALAETDVIVVHDLYVPALVDYVMWRCKSKGVAYAGTPDEAGVYFKSFQMFITANSTDSAQLASQMGSLKETPAQQQGSVQ